MTLHQTVDHALYDSSPPDDPEHLPPLVRFKRRITGGLSSALLPVVKRAARPYVGGDTAAEAWSVAERLRGEGVAATLGYWDRGSDTAVGITALYREAIEMLGPQHGGCYLSLKPPPLRFSTELAADLAATAARYGIRLHCDSHGAEVADLSNAMLEAMAEELDPALLGTTLPGRWLRSLRDAEWAAARGFNVRVVKGQWPDPEQPHRDIAEGYLAVIGALAGRARHVSVATHDFDLARKSLALLQAAGTPCNIEVLLGMPAKPLLHWAQENGVGVRIYVPYGPGFVPNALRVLKRNPRIVLAVAKDRCRALGEAVASVIR